MGSEKRKITTTHFSIFDYWKDKCITENGDIEIEIGYDGCDKTKVNVDNSIPVIEDWGEPKCFACGEEVEVYLEDGKNFKDIWNDPITKHELERAHIIPDSLGGEDSANNMFCLCRRCHRDSPDTIYAKEFFKWVYRRRKEGKLFLRTIFNAFNECCKQGINPLFINASKVFSNASSTISTHGGSFSEISFVSALVGNAEESEKQFCSLLNQYLTAKDGLEKMNISTNIKNEMMKFVNLDKMFCAREEVQENSQVDRID